MARVGAFIHDLDLTGLLVEGVKEPKLVGDAVIEGQWPCCSEATDAKVTVHGTQSWPFC